MNHHDHPDNESTQEMEALSRTYRAAVDADGMVPPAALDDAIRAAARRAVHAGPQPAGKSWIRRWTPQLAVAAVVVLSVSVVFVSIDERPDLAPAPIQKITQARLAEAPAEVAAPVPTKIIAAAPPHKEARADARSAIAPEPKPAEEKFAATGALRARDALDAPAKPAASNVISPPATATTAVPSAPVTSPQSPGARQFASAPTPSAGVAAAIARVPSSLDKARLNEQVAGGAGAGAIAVQESSPSGKPNQDERPGPWLKRLLELRDQGKLKELREELARFRKAHPDVVLPKVLTELPGTRE